MADRIPEQTEAIVVGPDGPSRSTVPLHEVRPGHLEIETVAGGLNRGDVYALAGAYRVGRSLSEPDRSSRPTVAGGEVSGRVTAVGKGVDGWKVGDRAMAFTYSAFRRRLVVSAGRVLPVPDSLDLTTAAAVPINFVTVHAALVTAGRLSAGETGLVNGASSGIGVATLLLAPHLGAGSVLAVSRSTDKLARLTDLGLAPTAGIVGPSDGFTDEVLAVAPDGVDVTIDVVGAGTLRASVDTAALGGRIVSIGRVGGVIDKVNLDELARKRLTLVGTTFRTRSQEEAATVIQSAGRDVLPLLADGTVVPIVDRVLPADDLTGAAEAMTADTHVGKIVLEFSW